MAVAGVIAGGAYASALTGVHVVADATVGSSNGLLVTCITAGGGVLIAVIGALTSLIRNRPEKAPAPDAKAALEDHALEQVVAEQAAKIVQLEATVAALRKGRSR